MSRDSIIEDTVILSEEKAKEIAEALRKHLRDRPISKSQPEDLPENANEIWFGKKSTKNS